MRKRLRKKFSKRPFKRIDFKLVDKVTGEEKLFSATLIDFFKTHALIDEVKAALDSNVNFEVYTRLVEKD